MRLWEVFDRLENLSFRATMYIAIGAFVLSISGIGMFSISELRDRDRLIDLIVQAGAVQTSFQHQVATALENKGLEDYEKDSQITKAHIQRLAKLATDLALTADDGTPLATRVNDILELNTNLADSARDATTWGSTAVFLEESRILTETLRRLQSVVVSVCDERTRAGNRTLLIVVLFVVVLLTVVGLFMLQQILLPLGTLVHTARLIGNGDLSQRVDLDLDSELGQLGITINEMTAGLGQVAKRINKAIDDLLAMSDGMSEAVKRQSEGANQQAAAVNEITATLEQIKTNSQGTLAEAENLRGTAEEISQQGKRGLASVEAAGQAMSDINHRMEEISQNILRLNTHSDQIGVITDAVRNLARQSKMLALNAAIEAAKAGEAGQGFGVVAAEVRHLSEQSERATEQVAEILEQIRQATESAVRATEEGVIKTAEGSEMVASSGKVVRDLDILIDNTTKASQRIAGAMREEALGIEQSATAMAEISGIISDFVAAAEQNERSAEQLNGLAERIKKTVAHYRL